MKATSFLRFVREIFALGIGFFYVLALSIANFQHSISKMCSLQSTWVPCKTKKLKPETSETLQTRCRNAATFVWLPRHYHKGLQLQVHLLHQSGCSCLPCCNQMLLCSQLFVARKSKVIFSTDQHKNLYQISFRKQLLAQKQV